MVWRNGYRAILMILLGTLLTASLVWIFVRAPAGTAPGAILQDTELVGRAQQVVSETAGVLRASAALGSDAARDAILDLRARAEHVVAAAEDLARSQAMEAADGRWIPVKEVSPLLVQCRDCGRLALEKLPTGGSAEKAAAQESLDPSPDLEGMTADSAQLLRSTAEALQLDADRLRVRVEQAIGSSLLARGTLLGLEAGDWLFLSTILCALVGLAVLIYASHRLGVPPQKIEQMEIRLIGRSDRKAALERCHDRIRGLLELAEQFYRGREA